MTANNQLDNTHTARKVSPAIPTDLSDWSVLIVDDVYDNISIAEAILKFNEADVQIATNGLEGLQIMESWVPNIILLDLSMPEMNGWEMHEVLRQMPERLSIAVIALTAHAMVGDREKVMEAGFDGYIAKPFSVSTFVEDITTILKSMEVGA